MTVSASSSAEFRPSAPTAVVRVGAVAARWTRAGAPGASDRQTPERDASRLALAVGDRALRVPAPDAPPPRPASTRGTPSYGAAAYAAVDALRARPRDEAVEVSVRLLADGGRLTVARRSEGVRTVAIEAQIA